MKTMGILACLFSMITAAAQEKPLKIYIMAGQSNMVGYGAVKSFDYIGDDPKTAPMLKLMRGAEGKPTVAKRVWISSFTGKQNQPAHEYVGKLCVGLGGRRDHSDLGENIGPEYPFGLVLEQAYDGPFLIIKTAWGGQSLCVHYRSPSAGPYVPSASEKEAWALKEMTEGKLSQLKQETGQNYRWMMDHVKKVLGDIKRVCPDYNEKEGYELAGFVWFQGWNDYVARGNYPFELEEKQYAEYSVLLGHFIRDIRKDLNAPKMPFVVGVIGHHGNFKLGEHEPKAQDKESMLRFRKAQAAPAEWPEFQGNVVAVPTAPFWDEKLMAIEMKMIQVVQKKKSMLMKWQNSPNADGKMTEGQIDEYVEKFRKELISPEEEALMQRGGGPGGWAHYCGSAKFHAQAGRAFAEALIALEEAR